MKKIIAATLVALLLPSLAYGAISYTKKVQQGRTIKVCSFTSTEVALVNEDGDTVASASGSKKPGKCAKLKTPKNIEPGTYTLETYAPTFKSCYSKTLCQTIKNDLVTIGEVEVVAKKAKKPKKR